MKTRTLVFAILLLLVVSVLLSSSFKKKLSTEEAMATLSGTWANEDTTADVGKITFKLNGTFENYKNLTDAEPFESGEYTLTANMIDSNGNIWLMANWTFTGSPLGTIYLIHKIDSSKTIMEMAFSTKNWFGEEFPAEIESNNIKYFYRSFYRQ